MNFKRFGRTANWFDRSTETTGYYIRKSDARIIPFEPWSISDYTAVLPNTQYTFEPNSTAGDATGHFYYNSSKEVIGHIDSGAQTFTTPQNCVYMRFSYRTESTDIMLNLGSTALPYKPYKDWTNTPHYIHNTSTDTIATLPAVVYPNDTTATVGLKGQAVQSSVPSSTSPVMPQGCGNKTANLFGGTYTKGFIGATYIYRNTGTSANCAIIPCEPSTTYTVKKFDESNRFAIGTSDVLPYDEIQLIGIYYVDTATTYTFTTNSSAHYIVVYVSTGTEQAEPRLMVNVGQPMDYQLPGYKIPILSADTTTNNYLGEVETTRKIKKLVLDGTEDWRFDGTTFYINISSMTEPVIPNSPLYCSHFVNSSQGMRNGTNWAFVTKYESATSSSAWKSYLAQQYAAGTPVCVWYVLATETTGIINEQLMKIGNYADTLSGISIPVTAGGDTLSVGTTIQPSEVTVNYKGWHPVQSVHERDNGAWT